MNVVPTDVAPTERTSRLALYLALNVAFILCICVAAAVDVDGHPRPLYVALLFALCSSPLLSARTLNDRYALYTMFLVIYFVSYGVVDILAMVQADASQTDSRLLSPAELLILLGAVAFICGYHASARRRLRQPDSGFLADDWSPRTLLMVGVILSCGGAFATWYWTVRLTVRSLEMVNNTGEAATTLLMIGRYAQPVGTLMLAYLYTIRRTKLHLLLMLAAVAVDFLLGFVSNTRSGAMMGGILVILTTYLVIGKLPKAWLAAGVAFIVFVYPLMTAYRMVVVGERGITNAQAAHNIAEVVELALQGEHELSGKQASFFSRASVKSAVEMIVDRTGVDVPYQHGYTLIPLLTSLIPRIIWPDKLDVQTGLLVNQEFHIAEAVVYISPSHLGELYWNFGWVGALGGMLLLGGLLGWINTKCDLSRGTSVTRLLILAVTIFETGVRFEGSIAAEYAVWLRSVIGIVLMHRLFACPGLRHLAGVPWVGPGASALPAPSSEATPRFSNLMT